VRGRVRVTGGRAETGKASMKILLNFERVDERTSAR
jgi:hypothetical protein